MTKDSILTRYRDELHWELCTLLRRCRIDGIIVVLALPTGLRTMLDGVRFVSLFNAHRRIVEELDPHVRIINWTIDWSAAHARYLR